MDTVEVQLRWMDGRGAWSGWTYKVTPVLNRAKVLETGILEGLDCEQREEARDRLQERYPHGFVMTEE